MISKLYHGPLWLPCYWLSTLELCRIVGGFPLASQSVGYMWTQSCFYYVGKPFRGCIGSCCRLCNITCELVGKFSTFWTIFFIRSVHLLREAMKNVLMHCIDNHLWIVAIFVLIKPFTFLSEHLSWSFMHNSSTKAVEVANVILHCLYRNTKHLNVRQCHIYIYICLCVWVCIYRQQSINWYISLHCYARS